MVVDNMVQSEALAEVIHWMVRQIAGKYRENLINLLENS